MVNPRIYRTFLGLAAFAVIVFGFSFQSQSGAASTTLAPPSFAGVYGSARDPGSMEWLTDHYPRRLPGSPGDKALAAYVGGRLHADGFSVSTTTFSAQTADGQRTLENVVATRPGITPGTIVVVSSRDSSASPATASLSGTAVLLELARVLSGETQERSLMLVSTSGTIGASGAARLASSLAAKPGDAVIVLGDLAGARVTEPVIVPWSDAGVLAPPLLRNTLAAAVGAQAALAPGSSGIIAQIAHLAFPLATTEQGPFGADGIPAVLLSVSGNRAPAGNESTDPARVAGLGQAVLEAVDALNAGPAVPAPSAYLILGGKVVPDWAVRLLVLALIAPVLITMIDALARVRRRGHSVIRWVLWVLAGAVPFALAFVLIAVASLTGWLDATPPGPVGAGGVRLDSAGIALLVTLALVIAGSFLLLRPLLVRLAAAIGGRAGDTSPLDGASVALMIVMSITVTLIWVRNPFSALLMVPALNLWLWLTDARVRARRSVLAAIAILGLLAPLVVIAYYAHSLGLYGIDLVWNTVLLVAGGQFGPLAAIYWSVLLGCVASALVIMVRSSGEQPIEETSVTIRGPVTYAGPGSLGGTKSALRR